MPGKQKKTEVNQPAAEPVARRTRQAKTADASAPTADSAVPRTRRPAKAKAAGPAATKTARPTTARRVSSRRQTAGNEPMAVAADRETAVAPAVSFAGPEPTHGEIAERAYFIHLERHGAPGDPSADWARAEYELRRDRGLI